jgi:GNAT superfamily N-acetyltransferase
VITVQARSATASDITTLAELYGQLESEMVGLKPIWASADGLAEPIGDAFDGLISRPDSAVIIGEIDDVPFGFLAWSDDPLLPQAAPERVATVRLIFTAPDARRVGVGEAMIGRFRADAEERGISLFDAIVPPGHRDAKNFFESHGFKARRIVMHRDDR